MTTIQGPHFTIDKSQQPLIKNNAIDFFITGLPRSRMAWIANYLTYGNMECHFDPLDLEKGIAALNPEWIMLGGIAKVVGVADSGLVFFQDRLQKLYPDAKWIVVQRPHGEVKASFQKLGVPLDNRLAKLNYKLEELKLRTKCLVVPFEDLDTDISKIATYVNPAWHCPKSRHDLLTRLNVQSKATVDDLNKIPEVNILSQAAEPIRTTKNQERYFAILQEICGDNKFAYRWLWQAVEAASLFDHVMDNDIIDYEHYDAIMKGLLLEWGVNPFYRQYAAFLVPTMASAISAWQHTTGSMKRVKHYDIYSELPIAVAYILHGQDGVEKFSPKIRPLVEQLMIDDEKRDEKS